MQSPGAHIIQHSIVTHPSVWQEIPGIHKETSLAKPWETVKHRRIAQDMTLGTGAHAQLLPLRQDRKGRMSDRMQMQAAHGIKHASGRSREEMSITEYPRE